MDVEVMMLGEVVSERNTLLRWKEKIIEVGEILEAVKGRFCLPLSAMTSPFTSQKELQCESALTVELEWKIKIRLNGVGNPISLSIVQFSTF